MAKIYKKKYGVRVKKQAKKPVVKATIQKRLDDGIQYKTTFYNGTMSLNPVYGGQNWFLYDSLVREIPKYGNDALQNERTASLIQSRTADKLFVKGFILRLGASNLAVTQSRLLRIMLFRNDGWDEALTAGCANLFKNYLGQTIGPNYMSYMLMSSRFNKDLCKKSSFFYDKTMTFGPRTLTSDNVKYITKYIPINQVVHFEEKGTSASSWDLKEGRYIFILLAGGDVDASAGTIEIQYNIDVVWAQS